MGGVSGVATMRYPNAICEFTRVLSDGRGVYGMVYTVIYLVLTDSVLSLYSTLAVTSRGYSYMGSGVKGQCISVALLLVIIMTYL